MEISVIILNWNGLELLQKLLPSVVAHTVGPDAGVTSAGVPIASIAEVVVADNGSADDSLRWVSEHCPQVRLLPLGSNLGFAAGYNKALEQTTAPFTVLLNSDVLTTPGWLVPLYEHMLSRPRCGAVQPKILSYRDRSSFEYAGAAGGLLDRNLFPYCRGRILSSVEKDCGQYDSDEAVEVAWASGAALMVRSDIYRRVGGLDEHFFAHMEEIDLCVRMRGAGYPAMALTRSAVYHIGGASLPQGNPRKVYLNFRNNLLLIYKNMPRRAGRWMLLRRRLIYDTAAFFSMVVRLQWRSAAAVLRAHRDFRRMRSLYTPHLPENDLLAGLPGRDRNIVTDFYLKRHPQRK